MCSKIIKAFELIKQNTFNRIIVELFLLVSLFTINNYVGLVVLGILLFEIIISKNIEIPLYIYLFLSFFDEVLIFDILKGSLSRIVMIIIYIKLGIYILKNKILPNKTQVLISLFFLFSFIIDVITNGFNLNSIIILVNVLLFIFFSMTIKLNKKDEVKQFIERLCYIIVFAVLGSVFYGLITNNFDFEIVNYETRDKIFRFNGTYEPNFMCMYINLGILSLLTIKHKLKKIIYFIFMAIMFNAVILTASITGIITLIASLFIYSFINVKNKNFNFLNLFIISIITLVLFFGLKTVTNQMDFKKKLQSSNTQIQENNTDKIEDDDIDNNKEIENKNEDKQDNKEKEEKKDKSSISQRIDKIVDEIKNGKLDDVTSGRFPLIRVFIKKSFNRPILNILFGNGLTDKKVFCQFFNKDCYSHNTYLDFLYNFGIMGFVIVGGYIIYKTKKNSFLNQNISSCEYSSNIKIIRFMLLMYALSLTLYTKRMFLIFFLL